jgi:tubulin alpha
MSTAVVEPYNLIVATHWMIDESDCTFTVDNQPFYRLCCRVLDVERTAYDKLNTHIAQAGPR